VAASFLALGVAAAAPSPVLFQASFEDTLDAVGAGGPVKPLEVKGRVEYRPGKVGRALLCGGDAALVKYPVAGTVRPTQGTIEMWVQAVDWPEGEQAFHVFFETEGPGGSCSTSSGPAACSCSRARTTSITARPGA